MKPKSELVERAQVMHILGIDRETLRHIEKQEGFPKKISFHRPVGGKMKKEYRWCRFEIMEWKELNRGHRLMAHLQVTNEMVKEFFTLMDRGLGR